MRLENFIKLRKSFIFLFLAFVPVLFSQNKKETEYSGFFDSYYFRGPVNFILGGGITGYSGDLKKVQPSYTFGGGATYKVWPRTYFGAHFNYLNLKGSDSDTTRNISFSNNMMELSAFCRFNLLDRKMLKNMDVKRKEMFFRPYLTLGVGVNRYKVVSSTTNPDWSRDAIPEGARYPKIGIFVPAGLGFAFFVTHRISILAEFNYRFPFNDYIDDVSARGNSKKDVYYSGDLKIQYSPFAPKRKKKHKFTEPAPYGGKVVGPPAPPSEKPKEETPATPEPDPNSQPTPEETKPAEQPVDDGWGTPAPDSEKKDDGKKGEQPK